MPCIAAETIWLFIILNAISVQNFASAKRIGTFSHILHPKSDAPMQSEFLCFMAGGQGGVLDGIQGTWFEQLSDTI